MSRKETVWCARHSKEAEEIERIINYYKKFLNVEISKLEASIILTNKSREAYWNSLKAKKELGKIRGVNF
jgi:hypothetical protein